jgi:hypothetical protein
MKFGKEPRQKPATQTTAGLLINKPPAASRVGVQTLPYMATLADRYSQMTF